MNGYETMSENYKILMQRGEIEKKQQKKQSAYTTF